MGQVLQGIGLISAVLDRYGAGIIRTFPDSVSGDRSEYQLAVPYHVREYLQCINDILVLNCPKNHLRRGKKTT